MKKNKKNLAEDRLVLKIFAFICFIVFSKDLRLSLLFLALLSAFGGNACLIIAKERNSKNFKTEQNLKQQSSSKIKIKKDRKENFFLLMVLFFLVSVFLAEFIFDKLGVPDAPYICLNSSSSICSIKYLGDLLRFFSNPSNLSVFLIIPLFGLILGLIFMISRFLGLRPPKE